MKRPSQKILAMALVMAMLAGTCGCDSEDSSSSKKGGKEKEETETTATSDTSDVSEAETSESETTPTYTEPDMDPLDLTAEMDAYMNAVRSLDLGTEAALSQSDAFAGFAIPEGAEALYAAYFQSITYEITDSRGIEEISGAVDVRVSIPDLTSLLPVLGEVYTYDLVQETIAQYPDTVVSQDMRIKFAYDKTSGTYLVSDAAALRDAIQAQLDQLVIRVYISQDEVNYLTIALISHIGNNDVAEVNRLAGGEIMGDWGIYAPIFSRIYGSAVYEVEITTPGVDATAVTIHFHFHDPNAAMSDLCNNHPDEAAPAFAASVDAWVNRNETADVDYSILAEPFAKYLENAAMIDMDVPCLISRAADGSLVFEPSVISLLINFDPAALWATEIPSGILFATADYLVQKGIINDFDREWIHVLREFLFVPIEYSVTPGYGIVEVMSCYYSDAYKKRRETPGMKACDLAMDFGLVFDHDIPAGTLYVDYYQGDKCFHHGEMNYAGNKSILYFGVHRNNGVPFESGAYTVVVFEPNDSTRTKVMCTITYAFP